MADAVQHNLQNPNNLTPAYALLSRMRLSSSTDVLASAEGVIQHIINAYSEPNLTPEEIQSRAAKREDLCASSAISAVLNLKRCIVNCDNVSGGIASRLQSS